MKRLEKFFATCILTRWLFPYHCPTCGEPLVKMTRNDLTEAQRLDLEKSRTSWFFEKYAYRCGNASCAAAHEEGAYHIVA